ncbi:MAG: hypothetical protein AAFO04_19380 [Cyanobacteria bacterium J06592_8]
MVDINDIDWERIASSLPEVKDARPSVAPLAQKDWYFEKVCNVVMNRSMAQDLQSLITAQLRRHEQARIDTIAFVASQKGMSFEDFFIAVATGKIDELEKTE